MKYKLQKIFWYLYRWYLIILKYRGKSREPYRCTKCDSTELIDVDKDYISYTLCEFTTKCKKCGHVNGHWAYGSWEPFI